MPKVLRPTEAETLYFGLDESNHASRDKKGEIVVAVVSSDREDSIVKSHINRRQNTDFLDSAEGPYDYRFAILIGEEYKHRHSSQTLVETAPYLVEPFMHPGLRKINIYLDGVINRHQKDYLRERFSGIEVVVGNFRKKRNHGNRMIKKSPLCPRVVYLADSLANSLYHMSSGELLSHKKFIPLK